MQEIVMTICTHTTRSWEYSCNPS